MKEQTKKWILTAALIIGALLSIVVMKPLSSPKCHKKAIETLTKKQDNVMVLTGVAAAASFKVSAIPGDTGTPVAEKLADLTDIFGIALIAILLEKYMLTVGVYVGFGYLIPIGLLLLILAVHNISESAGRFGTKLIAIGAVLSLLSPISVNISNLIDQTYSISYEETIAQAEQMKSDIEEATESKEDAEDSKKIEDTETTSAKEDTEPKTEKNKNLLTGIADTFNGAANGISNLAGDVADGVSGAVSDFAGNVSEILDIATKLLNNLIEAVAAMIITSCVIPLLTFVILIWFINMILGANIRMPHLTRSLHKRKKATMEENAIEKKEI